MAETVLQSLLVRLGLDIEGFTTDLDKSLGKLEDFGKGAMRTGAVISAEVSAPIIALGGFAFAAATKFDQAFDDIRAATGETGPALESLKESFRTAFSTLPVSVEAASTAISDLHQRLGLAGPALDVMAATMLNLARISGEQVGPLIVASAQAFDKWKVATTDQTTTLDFLHNVAVKANTSMGGLLGQVVAFAAPMQEAGFSIKQTASLFGALELAGVGVEKAMPGIRKAILDMAKAGIDPTEGFPALIARIKGAKDETEALSIGASAFGKRGGLDLVTAIRAGKLEVEGFETAVKGSTDTINKAAKDTESFSEKWVTFKNSLTTALEPLGVSLVKAAEGAMAALKPLIDNIKGASEWFSNLNTATQSVILGIGATVAALGPALLAFGAFAASISSIGSLLIGPSGLVALLGGGTGLAAILPLLTPAAIALGVAIAGWAIYKAVTELQAVNKQLDLLYAAQSRGVTATEAQSNAIAALESQIKTTNKAFGAHQVDLEAIRAATLGAGGSIDDYIKALTKSAGPIKQFGDGAKLSKTGVLDLSKALSGSNAVFQTATEKAKTLKEAEKALKEELEKLSSEMANDLSNAKYFEAQKVTLAAKAKALAEEEKRLTEQLAALDREMAELARSTPLLSTETQKLLDKIAESSRAASGIDDLRKAYDALGITVTTADLQKKADDLRAAYNQLALDSPNDLLVLQQAIVKVEEAEKAAKAAIGEWTPAMEQALQDSKAKLATMEGHVEPLKNKWTELGATIKGSVGGAIDDMVAMLFNGDMSFGERMKGMLKDIGIAVVDMFIAPAKKAIAEFISTTIVDLLSGKGLGGVLDSLKSIGSAMADVFKGAGGVATTASGAAGGVGGAVSGVGGAVSGTLGAVTGILGAIGSIGTMISGFIGNFQQAKTNDRLWSIEENTRVGMLYLGGRSDGGILGTLFKIAEDVAWGPGVKAVERIRDEMLLLGSQYINPSLDTLKGHTANMRDRLIEMRNGMGTTPPVSIVVQGNVIGNDDFLTQLADALAARLRLQGQAA